MVHPWRFIWYTLCKEQYIKLRINMNCYELNEISITLFTSFTIANIASKEVNRMDGWQFRLYFSYRTRLEKCSLLATCWEMKIAWKYVSSAYKSNRWSHKENGITPAAEHATLPSVWNHNLLLIGKTTRLLDRTNMSEVFDRFQLRCWSEAVATI